jgi:hypothetical protein
MRVAANGGGGGCEPGGCGHDEGQFDAGLAGRKRHMSVICNTLLITALALAVVLTIAWDACWPMA